jgi:hypothetical protein
MVVRSCRHPTGSGSTEDCGRSKSACPPGVLAGRPGAGAVGWPRPQERPRRRRLGGGRRPQCSLAAPGCCRRPGHRAAPVDQAARRSGGRTHPDYQPATPAAGRPGPGRCQAHLTAKRAAVLLAGVTPAVGRGLPVPGRRPAPGRRCRLIRVGTRRRAANHGGQPAPSDLLWLVMLTFRQERLTTVRVSRYLDDMDLGERQAATLATASSSPDPEVGLRAVAALRGLLEVLEALQVDNARPTAGPGSRSPAGWA